MPRSNINPMAGGTRPAVPAGGNALDLLPLAGARPSEALARARAILAERPSAYDASVAHQAIGIVLRDFGDVGAAVRELRSALRLARAAKRQDRQADVLATLGLTLVWAGQTRPGLASLDAAVGLATGGLAGRVLMRRAAALGRLGRHREALGDLRQAVVALRRAGDRVWEARALSWRGLAHLALGFTERADADFLTAERLFAATSQELELAYTTHNRGLIAFRSGDLPLALSYLDQAARRYESLQAPMPELVIDRCAVLLAAGLPGDARQEADAAIRDLERVHGQVTKKAELLLAAAGAALAAADPHAALRRAQAACRCSALNSGFGGTRRPGFCSCGLATRQAWCLIGCWTRPIKPPRAWTRSAPGRHRRHGCWPGGLRCPWAELKTPIASSLRQRWPAEGGGRPYPGLMAGSPRPCGPTRPPTRGGCSAHADKGSTFWTSTSSRWAPRNYGRRPPPGEPNSRNWRSSARCVRGIRGCCSRGVNAGGQPPWPCRQRGP